VREPTLKLQGYMNDEKKSPALRVVFFFLALAYGSLAHIA